jgi:colanic acid/amylovoran biosynthesis glycosyltransferase
MNNAANRHDNMKKMTNACKEYHGRMKIAFFVDHFPSHTQTFVLRQIAGVMEKGFPVKIFANLNSGVKGSHRLIDKHHMLAETIYLPKAPRSPWKRLIEILSMCSQPGWMKKHSHLMNAFNVFQYGRDAASLKLFYQCLPFLSDGHFDIVHSQFGWLGAAACRLRHIGVLTGKLVTSFRGYDTEQYIQKNPDGYRSLFRHGDLFLPVCDHFKQWLIANGCPESKVAVLRSGIDLAEFSLKVRTLQAQEPVRLLSVARMVEKKGLRFAIEAVARLRREGKDIRYTILGDGPLRGDLERQAAELGMGEIICVPGMKPHGEVAKQIQDSHILVAPSITAGDGDREGIPNVLKEAMATGMPVVSTWHSGIPELVADQKSGFLVPEKDVDALANRLRILIDHPDLWPQMGQTGRWIVEKQYDIDVLNARLLKLYASVGHNVL